MRNREIGPTLPAMERVLATAAAGQIKASRGNLNRRIDGSRGPRIAAIGLSCLVFGGAAMAATGIWTPAIGDSDLKGQPAASLALRCETPWAGSPASCAPNREPRTSRLTSKRP